MFWSLNTVPASDPLLQGRSIKTVVSYACLWPTLTADDQITFSFRKGPKGLGTQYLPNRTYFMLTEDHAEFEQVLLRGTGHPFLFNHIPTQLSMLQSYHVGNLRDPQGKGAESFKELCTRSILKKDPQRTWKFCTKPLSHPMFSWSTSL